MMFEEADPPGVSRVEIENPVTGRRGRPLEMQPEEVIQRIRELGANGGLFRVHLDQPALYARARRLFGTWAEAVARAGHDHGRAVSEARRRSVEGRRRDGAA